MPSIWSIVPYWSTDLLYAVSLFTCRTRKELSTHAKRLVAAQFICTAGFLLFPLQFTFGRPHSVGVFGWMFDVLAIFDKPFNQAPSLHLSLTTILWAKYSQHLHGTTLWLMRAWMVLVGVSTLTTYQHHFIDLPTGIWVGLFCIATFPDDVATVQCEPAIDPQRIKFSAAYLLGCVALVGLALRIGGAAWCLLWPAGALLIVTASGPEVGGVDGGGALDGGFETGGLETELVTVMVLLAVPVALSLAVAASVTT